MNGFSTEGTRAIGIALTLNKYLEHLDLSFNRVSNNAAADFARYFKINTFFAFWQRQPSTLVFVSHIMSPGCMVLIPVIVNLSFCSPIMMTFLKFGFGIYSRIDTK